MLQVSERLSWPLQGRIFDTAVVARQRAAILTAFLLPWSTSGLAVALAIFLVLAVLTIKPVDVLRTLHSPAGLVPILLVFLMCIGMLWSVEPLGPGGVSHYVKLLLIPIVMSIEFTPRQSIQVGYGFLGGCLFVLILSVLSFWIALPWKHYAPGIPFKENAVQSGNFVLCAFGLGINAVLTWKQGNKRLSALSVCLAAAFTIDVFAIYISKTGVLMAAALLGLLLVHTEGWKRSALIAILASMTAIGALSLSTEAQRRLSEISTDINAEISPSGERGALRATISTASRVDFWTKAMGFIREAPLLGHGTGSTKSLYQSLEASRPSPYGEAVPDPHNQFLAIAIQVGLLGGFLLVAMWISHAWTFRGSGVVNALGQAVVLQNVLGSLFNSHISTITQGSLYCLAVGLLAGLIARDEAKR
jgi:O-antigen ligase